MKLLQKAGLNRGFFGGLKSVISMAISDMIFCNDEQILAMFPNKHTHNKQASLNLKVSCIAGWCISTETMWKYLCPKWSGLPGLYKYNQLFYFIKARDGDNIFSCGTEQDSLAYPLHFTKL